MLKCSLCGAKEGKVKLHTTGKRNPETGELILLCEKDYINTVVLDRPIIKPKFRQFSKEEIAKCAKEKEKVIMATVKRSLEANPEWKDSPDTLLSMSVLAVLTDGNPPNDEEWMEIHLVRCAEIIKLGRGLISNPN